MTTALTRFFFRSPYLAPSTGTIVRWWESRRPLYNLAVGSAGLVSLATIALTDLNLPPDVGARGVPLGIIAVYGVLANLAYCVGPLIDLLIVRRWGNAYSAIGPTLFRYGFVFSVGLTLLPVPISIVGWCVRMFGLA